MRFIHKLLLMVFLLTSSIAFSQTNYGLNHSYFLTDDGRVHTVRSYKPQDNLIKLFSPDGFFILPENVLVSKSSYLIDNNDNLYTVDTNGYFYKYSYSTKVASKIKHAGESFFVTKDRTIHIVLTNGTIKSIDKKSYSLDSRIKIVGGNYLITKKDAVYMVNPLNGSVSFSGVEIKPKEIEVFGDNYFVTKEGRVYSFGLKADGTKVVKTARTYRFRSIEKAGGNYFIANNGKIYTIATDGRIDVGTSFQGYNLPSRPVIYGSNYFMLNDNSFYIVDQDGVFHLLERFDKRIIYTTK